MSAAMSYEISRWKSVMSMQWLSTVGLLFDDADARVGLREAHKASVTPVVLRMFIDDGVRVQCSTSL